MSKIYRPPSFRAPIDLDLSRNEGSPTVTDIGLDSEATAAITSRYPDTTALTAIVARRHGVSEKRVLVTAGGDDALFRCFLSVAGSSVVATTPSFEMIRRYTAQLETPLIEVPWWEGDFPLDGFLSEAEANPGMAVVVSPNNPTGNVVDLAGLRKVSEAYPLVVLDAAYADFADEDLTDAALEMGNVVVVRTLSKAYGLAGLRVGYLLGSAETVAVLAGYGSPYSVSSLSAALAANVLAQPSSATETMKKTIVANRDRLSDVLEELAVGPLPSQGNFVLATDVDPDWLVPAAASLGVGLRRFEDRGELARSVRITVPADNGDFARLEETLRVALAPEALLFDMDGVLVDVAESFRRAIVATAARFDVEVTPNDIAAAKARGNCSDDWELTRGLCAAAGVELSFDTVRDVFEEIYQGGEGTPGLKLKEHLFVDVDVLRKWSETFPLGIVTARPRKDAVELLERFDLAGFFAAVVAREDAVSKPDPAPVRLALDRIGVRRAWMVGDTVDDLAAARAAGVVPLAVANDGDDPTPLAGAARVMRSVNELEEVLDATR
jgi:histidinol-phosphate aminotransferase